MMVGLPLEMKDAPREGERILVRDTSFDGDYVVVFWDGVGWATGFGSEIDGDSIRSEFPEVWFPLPDLNAVEELSFGSTFRHSVYGLCHVRGVIDGQLVFRWWRRRYQDWEYGCEPVWLLQKTADRAKV